MVLAVERNFDPAQLRDDNGRWTDGPAGAAKLFTLDAFENLYGAIVDDRYAGDMYVSIHERGDFVLSFVHEDGRREILLDGLDAERANAIADGLDWAATAHLHDDDVNDPDTGLVDYTEVDDEIMVGYDNAGNVSLRLPKDDDPMPGNPDDYEVLDIDAADATDLEQALRDMADAYDELGDEEDGGDGVTEEPQSARARVLALADEIRRKYNPGQLRDPGGERGGQWVKSPGAAAEAAGKDLLRLAGKIDLDSDEKLVGSAKLDGDAGGVRMALTEQAGKRMLRLGLGSEGYGRRNRDEGTPAWDGNPSRAPLSKAEQDRLNAEDEDLSAEYETASPARREEIDNRQAAIREQLVAADMGFNGTAKIDEYSARRLIDRIGPALDEAVDQEKAENAAWDEIDALEAKGNPDPARMAKLRQIVDRGGAPYITFVEGIVPGSAWGDVHFQVELDDLSVGPEVRLGVMPKGAPDDWGDDKDWEGKFDVDEARKILRLLDKFSGTASRSRELSRRYAADGGGTRTGTETTTTGPKGGQFAPGGGRVGGKGKPPPRRRPAKTPAKPAGPLGYDGKTGAGYGIKGGDPRVRTLQSVLNRFDLKDGSGQPLAVDGKFGPRTTAAVKRLQRAMGEEPTGKVTEDFIKKVAGAKSLQDLRPPKQPPKPRKRVRRSADHLHELDNGICRTCMPEHEHVLDNGICQTCPH